MTGAVEALCPTEQLRRQPPPLLGIFTAWRLNAYGYALAAVYAALLFSFFKAGVWLLDADGRPCLDDFTYFWIGGKQVLRGEIASLYDPAQFTEIQLDLVGPVHQNRPLYRVWPYPPIFFLVLAPLAMISYVTAYLTWETATLLACIIVVYLIVRRSAAIALVLASPFVAMNIFVGQTALLRASLVGAALLALERWPALAGIFLGCLTYKPQAGVLFPVALLAAKQWRAFASAAITAAMLAVISIAVFGIGPWEAFPQQLLTQTQDYLLGEHPYAGKWTVFQTVYGLVRALDGGPSLAWLAQSCVTACVAISVWMMWRSSARYSLKAALLSAGSLLASPYGETHDLIVIAISVAFLASDQMRYGLLRGEQATMIALFGASFAIFGRLGFLPLGPAMEIVLMVVILRRAFVMVGDAGASGNLRPFGVSKGTWLGSAANKIARAR